MQDAGYDFWAQLEYPIDPPRVGRSTVHGEWAKVLRLDPCAYCGLPSVAVDHITPHKFDVDRDTPENLTGACNSCNGLKGDRLSLLETVVAGAR